MSGDVQQQLFSVDGFVPEGALCAIIGPRDSGELFWFTTSVQYSAALHPCYMVTVVFVMLMSLLCICYWCGSWA